MVSLLNNTMMFPYNLIAKGGYFLVALVCLSVCVFVDNVIQKVMNGLRQNFTGSVLGSTMKN